MRNNPQFIYKKKTVFKLIDYLKRFEELEPIAEYKKSDRFMERPCNNVSATWK